MNANATCFRELSPGQFFRFVPGYTVYEYTGPGAYRSVASGDEYRQADGWDAPAQPCGRRTTPRIAIDHDAQDRRAAAEERNRRPLPSEY